MSMKEMSETGHNGLGCRTVFDDAMESAVSPGAGDYDVAAALKHVQRNSPAITIEERYKQSPPEFAVGPGYYEVDAFKRANGPGLARSERFVEKPNYSPGPGDYENGASGFKSTLATFSRSGLREETPRQDHPDVGSYEVDASYKRTSKHKSGGSFTFGGRHKGSTY